jgi:hypothetical protein
MSEGRYCEIYLGEISTIPNFFNNSYFELIVNSIAYFFLNNTHFEFDNNSNILKIIDLNIIKDNNVFSIKNLNNKQSLEFKRHLQNNLYDINFNNNNNIQTLKNVKYEILPKRTVRITFNKHIKAIKIAENIFIKNNSYKIEEIIINEIKYNTIKFLKINDMNFIYLTVDIQFINSHNNDSLNLNNLGYHYINNSKFKLETIYIASHGYGKVCSLRNSSNPTHFEFEKIKIDNNKLVIMNCDSTVVSIDYQKNGGGMLRLVTGKRFSNDEQYLKNDIFNKIENKYFVLEEKIEYIKTIIDFWENSHYNYRCCLFDTVCPDLNLTFTDEIMKLGVFKLPLKDDSESLLNINPITLGELINNSEFNDPNKFYVFLVCACRPTPNPANLNVDESIVDESITGIPLINENDSMLISYMFNKLYKKMAGHTDYHGGGDNNSIQEAGSLYPMKHKINGRMRNFHFRDNNLYTILDKKEYSLLQALKIDKKYQAEKKAKAAKAIKAKKTPT